jgi:exonuclease SbcC
VILDFPDGVTGIVGLNGVGKSTIFEAIAWVMYGSVAARTSMEQIKRENSEPKESCRVELDFIFNEDKYRIVREMSGKSLTTSASVTINGKLVATGAEIVSSYIQKKFGMDFKSFFTSIFAKQKELNALSNMNPSERRPLILKMLGINSIDEIISEIRSDIRDKNNIIKNYELELFDEDGTNKIDVIKIKKKDADEKLLDISKSNDKNIKHIFSLEKHVKFLKKSSQEIKVDYEKLLKEKEQLEEEKSLFEKNKRLNEEIIDLEKKVRLRGGKRKKVEIELKKILGIDIEIKKQEKKQSENSRNLELILKKIEQKNTINKQYQDEIGKFNEKIKQIKKIGSSAKCPTCDRVLGEQYDSLIKNYSEEIRKKEEDIKKIIDEIKKVELDYDKLNSEKTALSKKNNFLQNELIKKGKIQSLLENIKFEYDRELNELNLKKNDFTKISLIKYDEKKYHLLKRNIEVQYDKYQKSLDIFNETRSKLERIKIDCERNEGEKRLINQQIKNFEQKINDINKIVKKMEVDKKSLQLLTMLNEIMNSFRTYLISQIRPTLSQYASELFNQLTDGRYSEIELDENYNLKIFDNGNSYGVERFSGGEEDLANLCIRLAISEVITSKSGNIFNLIILDEIFGSQDNMRKKNIVDALSKFSSKFRQIFLITHVDEIKNLMENTITVLEEENGVSKIKIE